MKYKNLLNPVRPIIISVKIQIREWYNLPCFVHDGCEMTDWYLCFNNWIKTKIKTAIAFPASLRVSCSLN